LSLQSLTNHWAFIGGQNRTFVNPNLPIINHNDHPSNIATRLGHCNPSLTQKLYVLKHIKRSILCVQEEYEISQPLLIYYSTARLWECSYMHQSDWSPLLTSTTNYKGIYNIQVQRDIVQNLITPTHQVMYALCKTKILQVTNTNLK